MCLDVSQRTVVSAADLILRAMLCGSDNRCYEIIPNNEFPDLL